MSTNLPAPRQVLTDLIDELGLETEDRDDELRQVQELLNDPGFDAHDLVDLEHLPFVTIDNADSRDLDQALYIERIEGGFRVDYALADAAWFIRPDTPLWRRAMRRGATFYFPDRAIPMLPEALSEGLISLNPKVVRRALVVRTELDASGRTTTTTAFRARIRSRAKLAYDQVSLWHQSGSLPDEPWRASLEALREVGELRSRLAVERGVVPYNRDEPTIRISDDGERCILGTRRRDAVQSWNEQISLLCNTEGAKLLAACDHLERVQSVYRVHAPPVERRLSELRETLSELTSDRDLPPAWQWSGDRRELADYLAGLPGDPAHERLQTAIERQILRTNRASEFTDHAGPHWALAVEPYVRLSSPMREMVGVFTHKELAEGFAWSESLDHERDEVIRDAIIEGANRARSVQKTIEKRVKLLALEELFAEDLERPPGQRPRRMGTVVGVRTTRLYLLLDEIPIDVKVYVDDLEQRYETTYRRTDAALVASSSSAPTFRLGDGLSFVVEQWDKGRQRFVLDVRSEE